MEHADKNGVRIAVVEALAKKGAVLLETRYLSIYRLPGLIGLPDDRDIELLPTGSDGARAFVTLQKDNYYLHVRRLAALGIMTTEIFAPAADGLLQSPPKERLERAMARVKIRDPGLNEALLIVEVAGRANKPSLEHLLDFGEFGGRLRLFDPGPQMLVAEKALRSAFAGLSIVLPEHATDSIHQMGAVAFAIEPESGRLLYSNDISASATMTVQTRLDTKAASSAALIAQKLRSSMELENVVRLLSFSSAHHENALASFLSAWTALELFVQKIFKTTYEPFIYHKLQSATSESAKAFMDRM